MKERMKKRGQLYLLAALVISSLIISLGATYNLASTTKEEKSFFGLSEEIDFEGSRVIDKGIVDDTDINIKINALAEYYSNLDPRIELVIIYGDLSFVSAIHYKLDSEGSACIQTGSCTGISFFRKIQVPITPITNGNTLSISLADGRNYDFILKNGQNFFIVLSKQKGGEFIVASPERKPNE